MNCTKCREHLFAHLEGVLEAGRAEVESHLADCAACRAEEAAITAFLDRMVRLAESVRSSVALEEPVMDRIAQHDQQGKEGKPMLSTPWRFFANPWRLRAASIVLVAVVAAALIVVSHLHGGYALAQSVEAHRAVRSVHVTIEQAGKLLFAKDGAPQYPPDSGTTEVWEEFGDTGKLVRLRADTAFSAEGPQVLIWHDGKADVWFPAKNISLTVSMPDITGKVPKEFMDPNSVVAGLQQRAAEGKEKVVETQPTDEYKQFKTEFAPKVLVVNPAEPQGKVEVYVIDPTTKLLQQMETYRKSGTELVFLALYRFDDYNLPIPADVFAPRLPADVMMLNQAGKELGLAQGNMTDAEVAKAALRQFFEALIAQDYDKASLLFSGFPVERLKKAVSEHPVGEIVSISEPTPDPKGRKDDLCVPFVVKCKDGSDWQGTANARRAPGQTDRWMLDEF